MASPVQMKKESSGPLLTVLCKPEHAPELTRLIFAETSTIGMRMRERSNGTAPAREHVTVPTPWGEVRIKAGAA